MSNKDNDDSAVRQIRRQTRQKYLSKEKLRFALERLWGVDRIGEMNHLEAINSNLNDKWCKITSVPTFSRIISIAY
mgnify:CR=1 FL=1